MKIIGKVNRMDSIIYTRIKELCLENNISQTRLEDELGLGKTIIAKWRHSSPNVESLMKVAEYFHVSVDYLIGISDIRATADDLAGDPDYVSIQRARERMTDQDKARMMGILRIGFDYAFSDEDKEER